MAQLSSVFREELKDRPAEILADPSVPTELAALAALIAGEPRRAVSILEGTEPSHPLGASPPPSPEAACLRHLAACLDVNWFPGGAAAILEQAVPETLPPFEVPRTGDPARDIMLRAVGELQPMLPSLRSILRGGFRMAPDAMRQGAPALAGSVWTFSQEAQAAGRYDVAGSCMLALADLFRLAGANEAGSVRQAAAGVYGALGDAAGLSLVAMQEADALIAPATSPDTLGLDLEDLDRPPEAPDAATAGRARALYEQARAGFGQAGAPRGQAALSLREGFLRLSAGDGDGAAEAFGEAERTFRDSGDGAGQHHALVLATVAAVAAGRLSEARPGPVETLETWVGTVGSRSFARGLGLIVRGVGKAWWRRLDVERARVLLSLAVDLALRFDGPTGQSAAYDDLADLFVRLNSRGPSIATLERAFAEHMQAVGDGDGPLDSTPWLSGANLLAGLFRDYVGERDPDGLERTAARCEALLARRPGAAHAEKGPVDPLRDLARWKQDLASLAASRFIPMPGTAPDADFEKRAVDMAADALAGDVVQARVMAPQYRGRRLRLEGRDAEADAEFARALDAVRGMGPAGAVSEIVVLGTMRRFQEAREKAATYLATGPDLDPSIVADLLIGIRDYAGALDALAAVAEREAGPATGPVLDEWRDLATRGEALAGTGDPAAAAPLLADGIARFEAWFGQLRRDAFRVSVADDGGARELYVVVAAVALATGRPDDAFAAGDRLRALALGDLLRQNAALRDAPPDRAAAILAWSQASAEWTGAYDVLAATAGGTVGPEEIASAQADLDRAQRALEVAESKLERAAPELLAGGEAAPLPPALQLDEVRELLPDDTLLIEYLGGADDLLVWTVDRRGGEGRAFPSSLDDLSGRVRRFHDACANRPGPPAHDDDAATLAEWLLEPVAERIRDYRRVLFVPSGPLHLLPFHALPFEGQPLGCARVVSYLPAAALVPYAAGRAKPRLEEGPLLVGDPAFAPGRGLRRLPGAGVEARAIAGLLGVSALTDAAATEDAVRQAVSSSPVVHLATHGLVSEAAPATSSIALAKMDALTVAELMGLAMDADLAVLSACDTGRGEVTSGGDVIGLVRGLLAAGARSAVVSLWAVDDQSGCLLMHHFYERLGAGLVTAEALHEAQAAVRGLDAQGRAHEYRLLAERFPSRAGPPEPSGRRARDAGDDDPPPDPRGPYWWAPFVHVGL